MFQKYILVVVVHLLMMIKKIKKKTEHIDTSINILKNEENENNILKYISNKSNTIKQLSLYLGH